MLYADNVMVGTYGPPKASLATPRSAVWSAKEIENFMIRLERVGGIGSSRVSIAFKELMVTSMQDNLFSNNLF